jgi:hypothetical protein
MASSEIELELLLVAGRVETLAHVEKLHTFHSCPLTKSVGFDAAKPTARSFYPSSRMRKHGPRTWDVEQDAEAAAHLVFSIHSVRIARLFEHLYTCERWLTGKISWSIALLAPHQYEKVQDRLPALNVDFHPKKPAFNESKIALLVEDRPLPHLTPLLLHMMSVVPPDWRFVLVGSRESLKRTNSSSTVRLQQDSGKLELRESPNVGDYQPQEKVDRMLTNLTFYENYTRTAEWLLVFHPDSVICARSETTVDDWLIYDWIGAPSFVSKSPIPDRMHRLTEPTEQSSTRSGVLVGSLCAASPR